MAERIERDAPASVDAASVRNWCDVFGEDRVRHSVDRKGWVAPPTMLATFGRPATDPGDGSTQLGLHDQLKAELSLPVGIALGYELECHAMAREGDRLRSVERIASVGELRSTRLGPGRDWVIEVATSNQSDELVCIERWSMLGYDPNAVSSTDAPAATRSAPSAAEDGASTWSSTIEVTRDLVIGGATANRVWALGHHDDDAARAAGLAGIILDTSTWVSIAGMHASKWIGHDARPGGIDLTMRRSVGVGDTIELCGDIVGDVVDGHGVRWVSIDVVGRVRGRIVATAMVRLAVDTADSVDVWALDGERWEPSIP